MKIKEVVTERQTAKEEYNLAAFSAPTATLGPDNVLSPVGSIAKSQRINTRTSKKRQGHGRIN